MKKIFLMLFLLSAVGCRLSAVFCQEPIILPPVTITGEDKSQDIFKRFQRQPDITKVELPKISYRRQSGASLFSFYFSAGGYNYLNWKMSGGKEFGRSGLSLYQDGAKQTLGYLALIEKLRMGPYGSTGKLKEYDVDNFNLDLSFPFFGNTNLFSLLRYHEYKESLLHPFVSFVLGGNSNTINHRARDAGFNLGWRGNLGSLVRLTISPYCSYVDVKDERVNVDTQVVLNQEISAGLKLNAQAEMKYLSLVGDVQAEGSQRCELNKNGTNVTVYVGGKFGIPRFPRLNLDIGLQYMNPYLFSQHFNPGIGISYILKSGLLLQTIFKGETILPAYKLFTGNYIRFNSLLKEEQDWSFSLLAEKDFGKSPDKLRGDVRFEFLHKNQENFISAGNRYVLWQPFNISRAEQFNFELSSGIFCPVWKGDAYGRISYTFRQVIPGEGKSVPYLPDNGLLAKIGYEAGSFKAEISGNYYSSCYADTDANSVLPEYFITNLNISIGITEQISILFAGENLFNVNYYKLEDCLADGLNFKGGMEIKF